VAGDFGRVVSAKLKIVGTFDWQWKFCFLTAGERLDRRKGLWIFW